MGTDFLESIAERFLCEARSFVDELIWHTTKYKQLQSLSEQLPHDYHDRFLVELIQNAHDASSGGECRIIFDESGAYGSPTLYVANQGYPFDESNFTHLCSMALSDKDPEKAIGSKGLGFRSVLQICSSPMIFSAFLDHEERLAGYFQGYCFCFNPISRNLIKTAVEEVVRGDVKAGQPSPSLTEFFGHPMVLIEEQSRIDQLRQSITSRSVDVETETQGLSPYSLPLPTHEQDDVVRKLYQQGFVTVIQLPLLNVKSVEAVRRTLKAVCVEYVLFTPKLTALSIEHHRIDSDAENLSCTLLREQIRKGNEAPPRPMTGVRVLASPASRFAAEPASEEPSGKDETIDERVWWMSETLIQGERLDRAISQLPPIWHKVEQVKLTIAVERRTDEPADGLFSIYLPTNQKTGTAVSVNGPFYGNLSRTNIDFMEDYNILLLETAAKKVVEIVLALGETKPDKVALAIVDLFDVRDTECPLVKQIYDNLSDRGESLGSLPTILTGSGSGDRLAPLSEIRFPPVGIKQAESAFSIFTPSILASEGVCIPHYTILQRRRDALERLAEYAECSVEPSDNELATWMELVAHRLKRLGAGLDTWNKYYQELAHIVATGSELARVLRTRGILLTQDMQLAAADDETIKVFAFPSIYAAEGSSPSEKRGNQQVDPRGSIPPELSQHVAFFNREIKLYEDGAGRTFNKVGNLLRNSTPPFVREFRVESIVNEVLVPLVEKDRTIALNGRGKNLYAQALGWAFHLYQGARSESTFRDVQFQRLKVPTTGGWKPGSQAYFSREWKASHGETLDKALPVRHPSRKNLLLDPIRLAHLIMGSGAVFSEEDLRDWTTFMRDRLEVYDVPRPKVIRYQRTVSLAQQSALVMYGSNYIYHAEQLENALGLPDNVWQQYTSYLRNTLNAPVQGWEQYVLSLQATLDGLKSITIETVVPYAKLVMLGFDRYKNLLSIDVKRPGSPWGYEPQGNADSTLAFALKHLKWLPGVIGRDSEKLELCAPDEVWFVDPALLETTSTRIQYSFIRHLPPELVQQASSQFCEAVGIRSAKIGCAEDGLALLDDLAASWQDGINSEWQDYFIGLWQDTLAETARYWGRLDDTQRANLRESYESSCLNGVLVYPPGRRSTAPPEWQVLSTEGEDVPIVYVPDDKALRYSLGEYLDTVVMKLENVEAQLSFLQTFFGSRIARISDVHFDPLSNGQRIEEMAMEAALLSNIHPWLQVFALAVFAFGRSQEMSVQSSDFLQAARRFQQLKYLEVADLQVTLGEVGVENRLMPTSHYWAEQNTILVDPVRFSSFEDFTPALKAFFGVSDIEHPLRLALSKLSDTMSGENDVLTDEQLLDALDSISIDESQLNQIRRALVGDDRWVLERLVPVVCVALQSGDKGASPSGVKDEFYRLAGEKGVQQALQVLAKQEHVKTFSLATDAIYDLILRADTDDAVARALWDRFGVPLHLWNQVVENLGYPYHTCSNLGVDAEFVAVREQLSPLVHAIIRRTLTDNDDEKSYRHLKYKYAELEGDPEWKEKFWELPTQEAISYIYRWLEEIMPEMNPELLRLLYAEDEVSIPSLLEVANKQGILFDHDDDANAQLGRNTLTDIYNVTLEYLLATWGQTAKWRTSPPSSVYSALNADALLASDEVLSICELHPPDEKEAMHLVLTHFNNLNLLHDLGIGQGDWGSLQEMKRELKADEEVLKTARQVLAMAHDEVERRGRIRSVLDAPFLVPRGDVFGGLANHVDKYLDAEFGANTDLFSQSELSTPPEPHLPSIHGRGRRGGGRASKPDELSGAVAEYLVYKVLHRQLKPWFSSSAWKSSNRRHFFTDFEGDDGLGYDFEFMKDEIQWQVEVKAVTGSRQFIDMGPTEVEAAHKAVRGHGKICYTIYVVRDPLTNPRINPLGNPYSRQNRTRFRIDEAGSRIHFRLASEE